MIPLYDTVRSRSVPWVTWGLLTINVLVFAVELTLPPHGLRQMIRTYGVVPHDFALMANGHRAILKTLLPYLTCMFLHGGWAHVAGNMLYLFVFAHTVEDRQGSWTFLAFYLFCGLAAGLAQTLVDPQSTLPTIGASGAIAGVLGAYVVYAPGARIVSLLFLGIFITTIAVPAWIYLGLWFLMQAFSGAARLQGFDAGGIAYFAHVGGFVAGLVLAPFLRRDR